MAKIDLDSLGIEELASLRENATDKLFEKVAARRAELEAELEKLAQYGKPVKKAESAPAPGRPGSPWPASTRENHLQLGGQGIRLLHDHRGVRRWAWSEQG